MLKGSIQARRDRFIKGMIDYGSQSVADMVRAYKLAYPQCQKDETARVSAYKLLQVSTVWQAIDKGLKEKEEAIRSAKAKEIERIAREQIISETQIDARLSAIVMGTHRKKRNVVAFNKETKQFHKMVLEEEPDESAMVAAANLLFKRKGSFAPVGVKHEAGDSFVEILKKLSEKRTDK